MGKSYFEIGSLRKTLYLLLLNIIKQLYYENTSFTSCLGNGYRSVQ